MLTLQLQQKAGKWYWVAMGGGTRVWTDSHDQEYQTAEGQNHVDRIEGLDARPMW